MEKYYQITYRHNFAKQKTEMVSQPTRTIAKNISPEKNKKSQIKMKLQPLGTK